ncbi:MAG: YvcK family protein [bacterium]|nr:YvcK family protein [bacterium]
MRQKQSHIVVIGGGTGTYTVLSGLKKHPVHLTAIVSMADDGGSTGVLRDELGVLPPGDVRQCLVALSTSDLLMRELMNYRFQSGRLKGHSFGNILLSALEKTTGSFDAAVEKASQILRLEGEVVPATLSKVRLFASMKKGKILRGQKNIHNAMLRGLQRIFLSPCAKANSKALSAIQKADIIVLGPGDFYSSLVPNLLVKGIALAIQKSKAKKIYVCNLMTKASHTDEWSVSDYTKKLEYYLGCSFDIIIYNSKKPENSLVRKYAREGEHWVRPPQKKEKRFVGGDLINRKILPRQKSDRIWRSLIRHHPDRLARAILRHA